MGTPGAGREYVDQMREEGYSDTEIREVLREGGWTDEQITRALAADGDGPPPPPEEPSTDRDRREKRAPVRSKSSDGTAIWILVMVGCLGMIVVVGAVLAAIMFPVFARAREKAQMASCQSNLKQISLAHLMYAQDHHEHFVTPDRWPEKLHPYLKNSAIYMCPSDTRGMPPTWQGNPIGYTLNSALPGLSVKGIGQPNAVALSYDGTVAMGNAGDADFRHNDGANCAYVDGHVKWVPRANWLPSWTAPLTSAPGPPQPPAPAPANRPSP